MNESMYVIVVGALVTAGISLVSWLVLRAINGANENMKLRDQNIVGKIDGVSEKVSGLVKGMQHVERQQEALRGHITELGQAHSELKGYVHARLDSHERGK